MGTFQNSCCYWENCHHERPAVVNSDPRLVCPVARDTPLPPDPHNKSEASPAGDSPLV